MRKKTLRKWLPIFEAYDPRKHGTQRAYCESIGVSYNQYKVYKHRLEHGQKSYSKYVKKGSSQNQEEQPASVEVKIND